MNRKQRRIAQKAFNKVAKRFDVGNATVEDFTRNVPDYVKTIRATHYELSTDENHLNLFAANRAAGFMGDCTFNGRVIK